MNEEKVFTEENEEQQLKEKFIKAPDHCNFKKDEIIPMKGYRYKFVGYTEKFFPVFECLGPTSKNKYHRG